MDNNTDCIQEIRTIFEDYFGEEYVDVQDSDSEDHKDILVHFPCVTVTNEHNKSEVIYDLFTKVPVYTNGRMVYRFKLARTTYTKRQAVAGYTHSHLPRSTSLGEFGNPCLGTGPINSTIYTLESRDLPFEERKAFWELFCRELDEYTQVESLKGGPYIRLESIGSGESRGMNFLTVSTLNSLNLSTESSRMPAHIALGMLKSGMLKLSFNGDTFTIGMPDTDFAILATNIAYHYAKENFPESFTMDRFIRKYRCNTYILNQGMLCKMSTSDYSSRRATTPIVFKGRTFPIKVLTPKSDEQAHTIVIISEENLGLIKSYILYFANAVYGKTITPEDAIFVL